MHYEVLNAMCAMTQKYGTPNGSKERKEHQRETHLLWIRMKTAILMKENGQLYTNGLNKGTCP